MNELSRALAALAIVVALAGVTRAIRAQTTAFLCVEAIKAGVEGRDLRGCFK